MATKVVYSDKNRNNYVVSIQVTETADDITSMIHAASDKQFIHLHKVAGNNIYILASSVISMEDL